MPPPLALERATDITACTADGYRSSLVPQSWRAVTLEAGEQPRLALRGSAQMWTGALGPAGPERACTSPVVEKTRYDVHALVDTCTSSSALSDVCSGPDTCRTVSAA